MPTAATKRRHVSHVICASPGVVVVPLIPLPAADGRKATIVHWQRNASAARSRPVAGPAHLQ
jgi:hypothetical protein